MSEVTRSSIETAPAKPQFSMDWIFSMITCVIMVSRGPPRSAGVMKKPSAVMKTRRPAAATPGRESGK